MLVAHQKMVKVLWINTLLYGALSESVAPDSMNDGDTFKTVTLILPPNLRLGEGKSLDVGVDGNNLHPMSLDEILSVVKNQPIRKLSLPAIIGKKNLI